MMKLCVIDEKKRCDDCGECTRCDLDENKRCDNCMRCVRTDADYAAIEITDVEEL